MKFLGYVLFWAVLSHLGGWQYISVGISAMVVFSLLGRVPGSKPEPPTRTE